MIDRPLSEHALAQRIQSLWKLLAGRHGEPHPPLVSKLHDAARLFRCDIAVPGYGVGTTATMTFDELWQRGRGGWQLSEYLYEYRREPGRSGRKAHHLHAVGGLGRAVHAHCEDPEPRHAHYRDVRITLLEAADDFARAEASGELDCDRLLPLLPSA